MKLLIVFLFLSLYITPVQALDLSSYLNKAKNLIEQTIKKLVGEDKVEEPKRSSIYRMPTIPKVSRDAKSVAVYNKTGRIYQQGESYKKLSREEKRKYRVAFVQELYIVVFGAEGLKQDIFRSLNMLEGGGSREGLYRSLVLAKEYSSLEGYEEEPSEALTQFSIAIGREFLNRVFSATQLNKVNLYGQKRVMTEKLLEVLDAFPKDGEDLYVWYALFSERLSTDYAGIWRLKTRTQKSAKYHYNWAKQAPLQHIKSEVIIKMHKVMNYLQR